MRPVKSLPYGDEFASADDYVDQLLHYIATTPVFQVLAGGVHIMDFYTTDPGLFYSVVPADWQAFLLDRAPMELLDFLLRDDVETAVASAAAADRVPPPESLVQYVRDIRRLSLQRTTPSAAATAAERLPRKITMGMSIKKIHEVTAFAAYVERLADAVTAAAPETPVTHLVDVGSGQNYLGRALASRAAASPCDGNSKQNDTTSSPNGARVRRGIVAVESKGHNIAGAKGLDMMTGVMTAPARPMRNKKLYQQMLSQTDAAAKQTEKVRNRLARTAGRDAASSSNGSNGDTKTSSEATTIVADLRSRNEIAAEAYAQVQRKQTQTETTVESDRLIQYVEGRLESGDLSEVLAQVQPMQSTPVVSESLVDDSEGDGCDVLRSSPPSSSSPPPPPPQFLTVSIHSCGNLSHYGLRALVLNPAVRAVAIVGCCYNLLTERLGPPTYKVPGMQPRPTLQPVNGRVLRESARCDPEGFPMSERLATYVPPEQAAAAAGAAGIRFNITARMMACQAPGNWTEADSEAFFTRHFYRAILQRILLDRGVVQRLTLSKDEGESNGEGEGEGKGEGHTTAVTPLIVGSLRKACYSSLPAYVRGAVAKVAAVAAESGNADMAAKMAGLDADGLTDADLEAYNQSFVTSGPQKRRELSAVWSLMAFSAGVVESAIVADRWLYLREQPCVRDCWAESVFSYDLSPRNMVVVGIKDEDGEGH